MKVNEITYPAGNVLGEMACTVRLSGIRTRLMRLAIAKWIIWFGVQIAGMKGRVEIE